MSSSQYRERVSWGGKMYTVIVERVYYLAGDKSLVGQYPARLMTAVPATGNLAPSAVPLELAALYGGVAGFSEFIRGEASGGVIAARFLTAGREMSTIRLADRIDKRLAVKGGPSGASPLFSGTRVYPVVEPGRYPYQVEANATAVAMIGGRPYGYYATRGGAGPKAVLYPLDAPANKKLFGIATGDMESGALYRVAQLAGHRARPKQQVPSSRGTPRGAQNAASDELEPGEDAYCVRDALLSLPVIQSDPALIEAASGLPPWTSFAAMSAALRGKHTPGRPRVLTIPVKRCDISEISADQEYLLRPSLPNGEPCPHCIAAYGGVVVDGDRRVPLSSGLAAIGYGPLVHSGRVLLATGKKRKLAK